MYTAGGLLQVSLGSFWFHLTCLVAREDYRRRNKVAEVEAAALPNEIRQDYVGIFKFCRHLKTEAIKRGFLLCSFLFPNHMLQS